jgi:hypothetical protein
VGGDGQKKRLDGGHRWAASGEARGMNVGFGPYGACGASVGPRAVAQ